MDFQPPARDPLSNAQVVVGFVTFEASRPSRTLPLVRVATSAAAVVAAAPIEGETHERTCAAHSASRSIDPKSVLLVVRSIQRARARERERTKNDQRLMRRVCRREYES